VATTAAIDHCEHSVRGEQHTLGGVSLALHTPASRHTLYNALSWRRTCRAALSRRSGTLCLYLSFLLFAVPHINCRRCCMDVGMDNHRSRPSIISLYLPRATVAAPRTLPLHISCNKHSLFIFIFNVARNSPPLISHLLSYLLLLPSTIPTIMGIFHILALFLYHAWKKDVGAVPSSAWCIACTCMKTVTFGSRLYTLRYKRTIPCHATLRAPTPANTICYAPTRRLRLRGRWLPPPHCLRQHRRWLQPLLINFISLTIHIQTNVAARRLDTLLCCAALRQQHDCADLARR